MVQVKNFGYLSILKIFTLLVPIVTYPYLIGIIGKEIWGELIFAQVIISYFSLLINFGYDVSATREISIERNNKKNLSKIVSSVYWSKFLMLIAISLVFILLLTNIPFFISNQKLYIFTFLMCIGDFLFPMWFFLGTEKMKYITFINLFVRLLFLLLVFIFIKEQSDYILVPIFNGMGGVVSGLFAIIIMCVRFQVKFITVSFVDTINRVRSSVNFFITDLSVILKDRLNILIIGSFIGFSEVAYYDLGTKIVHIAQTPFSIVNSVLLPNFSKTFSRRKLKMVLAFFTAVSLIACVFLLIFADFIVLKLGGIEMMYASNIIYIYSIVIPIACISSIYGIALASQGLSKKYMLADIYAFVVYFCCILSLIWLDLVTIYSFLISIIVSVIFTLMYKYRICKENNLT
ncbi:MULTISPECIES: oligosaccharide flippase family protein [Capnocytophaga]|nr:MULTISPECIES: oligosaccharide flippase family protein [Capnocytophaga]